MTALYKKCLEFTIATELTITDVVAPPVKSCAKASCDEPAKIIMDIKKVTVEPSPDSIPITPKIIPNGTTGIRRGRTSKHPFEKILYLMLMTGKL